MRARLLAPLAVGIAGASAVAAVAIRDPHVTGSWGTCPLLATTGLYCPGCGGLRAVHDLTRLDLLAALSSNLVAVALVFLGTSVWVLWLTAAARRRRFDWERWITPAAAWTAFAVVVVFAVLRNVPAAGWLAP